MAKSDMTDEALNVANQLETFALAHGGGRLLKDAARLLKEMHGKAKVAKDMGKSYKELARFCKGHFGIFLKSARVIDFDKNGKRVVCGFTDACRMKYTNLIQDAENYVGFCGPWGIGK